MVLIVATAVPFGLLTWRIGWKPELSAYCLLAAVGVVAATIDVIEHRLPSLLILPAYPGLFGLAAALQHAAWALARAVLSMAALFAGYLLLAASTRGGIGAGDVKLAGLIGLALGWRGWFAVMAGSLVGFLLGAAAVGLVLICVRKADRRTPVPLGPALLAGAFLAIIMVK
jgi:leader peptidase (prepilin peptidase) / N-methyltransferase